ncbi:citrate synthase [Rhizobium sp. SIMBA_035]
MSWLTAEEALAQLGTKPQTLYANVSRGRIRAKADPADPRRSLYHTVDVTRLAERHAGRRKSETVAAEAIQWGDPVLPSAVSTIADGKLYYRGRDAVSLSASATLEAAAAVLWDAPAVELAGEAIEGGPPVIRNAFLALAGRVTRDLPSLGRSRSVLRSEAISVFSCVSAALAPGRGDFVHMCLANAWSRPEAADCLRRALVLLADHELNASTFAARVTASSGASLSAAVLSGLSALTGPLHGGAWQGVSALADMARHAGAEEAVRRVLSQGNPLPAFGHPLYPDGDIRASALLQHFEMPRLFEEIRKAGEAATGERANVDFALTAMAESFALPGEAAMVIFALARTCGWLAHAMEQVEDGHLIRPRARYCGPALVAGG